MSLAELEHWVFLASISGSAFMVYTAFAGFKTDLKELSHAIFSLKEEFARANAHLTLHEERLVDLESRIRGLEREREKKV